MSNPENENITESKDYKSQKVHITIDRELVKEIEEIQELTGISQKTAAVSLILKKMTPVFKDWFKSDPLKQSNTVNNTYYSEPNGRSQYSSVAGIEDHSYGYEELAVKSNNASEGIPDLPSDMPPLF